MTNLEWLLSLPVEDIEKRYYREECTLCIYDDSGDCGNKSCIEGKLRWLSKEHIPEIKPCPFCGSESVYILSKDGYNDKTAIIFCNACKSVVFIEDNEGEGFDDKTVARAIEAWNRRANDGKVD